MATTTPKQPSDSPAATRWAAPPGSALTAAVAGISAAWIAGGSAGMIAAPLQHALTWLALAVALLAGWPRSRPSAKDIILLSAAAIAAVLMTMAASQSLGVLAVAVVMAALANSQPGVGGRAMRLAALAVAVLGVFCLACDSIPIVWSLAGAAGGALGRLAGGLVHRPLHVAGSFGGINYLVLMTTLYVGWLICTARPRKVPAIWAAAAILLGHLAYLMVLAFSQDIVAALPDVVRPQQSDMSLLGVWTWGNAVRTLLPWNLPALALLIHAGIAAAMLRTGRWLPVAEDSPGEQDRDLEGRELAIDALLRFGTPLLAAILPLLVVLTAGNADLKGRKIVVYDAPGLDWSNPKLERKTPRTARMYGMLPDLIASLGGELLPGAQLSKDDLAKADVLVILAPSDTTHAKPLSKEQIERVRQFVAAGGSLLVAATPKTHARAGQNFINELLATLDLAVGDDATIPVVKNWEGVCQTMPHPATIAANMGQNGFGLSQPVTVLAGLFDSPLLIGRWAWSRQGSDAVHLDDVQYATGDTLGDLVLAAQRSVGKGQVVVVGDAGCLANDRLPSSYPFVARLLGSLAAKSSSPQAWWRQAIGLFVAAGLIGLLAWRADPMRIAVAAVALGVSLFCCVSISDASAKVLPDGRPHLSNNLAYIDASHLEAYGGDPWRDNGIGEFARVLSSNGYMPLVLGEVDAEHLERAALLVSIAPARSFSGGERKAVQDFVQKCGVLVSMVGAEDVEASRELLADFQLEVPPMPVPPAENARETVPLGGENPCMFVNKQGHEAYVHFFAGWPVRGTGAEATVTWSDGKFAETVVASQRNGAGAVVLIGDTCFAMNKNMSEEFDAAAANARFWRWLLLRTVQQEEWLPPKEAATEEPVEGGMLDEKKGGD
jgi:hypothetical protein